MANPVASALFSDADVGLGDAGSAPKLLSDADVGLKPPATAESPAPPVRGDSDAATTEPAQAGQPAPARARLPGLWEAPSPATGDAAFDVPGGGALPSVKPVGAGQGPIADTAARLGRALIEGWKDTPDLLTPKAQEWLANAERDNPRPNLQDVLTVGHAALAAGNAVFRGGLEGIAALGEAAGVPQLGRDVAGYYEAMGMAGVPHAPGVLRATLPETRAVLTERALAGLDQEMPTASTVPDILGAGSVDEAISHAASVASKPAIDLSGTPAEQMARLDAEARGEGYTDAADKLTQEGAAGPQSAGAAAAPQGIVQQTASEISAAQAARERRLLTAPRIAGFDDSMYVPGERPLLFEVAGDPAVSLEAKQLMQDPKYAGRFADALRQNNQARVDFLNRITGDATDIERMQATRDAQAETDRTALWRSKSPVDAQPVVNHIEDTLAGPAGKVDAVRTVLQKIVNGLYDADGNLETDPEILYGVRKNISTMLSKEARQQEPMNQHAAAELMGVRAVLDGVIATGAPAFPEYLRNFAEASRPIDAMQVLQDKLGGVYTGADRNLTFSQFDNRLKQIIKMREMPGVNPAKSIPDAAMDALFALDNSLARATNIDLGKARGSDTTQLMRLLGYTPEAIAHGVAAAVTGGNPFANLAVRAGAAWVERLQAARAAKNQDALVAKHLDPDIELHPVADFPVGPQPIAATPQVAARPATAPNPQGTLPLASAAKVAPAQGTLPLTAAVSPQIMLLRQTEAAILRAAGGDVGRLSPAQATRLADVRASLDAATRGGPTPILPGALPGAPVAPGAPGPVRMAPAPSPQVKLLRQIEAATLRTVGGDESRLTPAQAARLADVRSRLAAREAMPRAAPENGVAPPRAVPAAQPPEAPATATAPEAAASAVQGPPQRSQLEQIDPRTARVDAARFQFKSNANEQGVTERLQDVNAWDERLAGVSLVWRDANGQDWVADGHQRFALANRLMDAGHKPIRVNAYVLDSADGVTDAEARAIAAAKNIAEGTGTAIDAAKVFRAATESGIELPELPPRSVLARDGRALARLSEDAFGMAVNDVVPTNQAALVGRLVNDPAEQVEAMRVLATAKPENARQAEIMIRDMLSTGMEHGITQAGLFGKETVASSVTLERAKILDEAARQLARDKTTFRTLVAESDRIQAHGMNALDVVANRERLSADEQASQLITGLATHRGPVSDALSDIARRFKSGDLPRAAAAREFIGVVRGSMAGSLGAGANAGGAVAGEAGNARVAAPPPPS